MTYYMTRIFLIFPYSRSFAVRALTQGEIIMSEPRIIEVHLNAFCKDTSAYLEGVAEGPLTGLTFAAKDIFDIAGHVTGCGNPDWKRTHGAADTTAWAVQALVDAGATMVGKTITDELTRGIRGENAHYGTPVNPRAPDRVPGGSSSGSASAVAGGLVDFALGSDTGGSVRVPASFCGLFGIRPTHGRIPLDGMLLQAPSYDTIGWFARDAETFARVGAVLLRSEIEEARPCRLVIGEDAFEAADRPVAEALRAGVDTVAGLVGDSTTTRLSQEGLDVWRHQQGVLQGREAWETAREWIDRVNPRFGFDVAASYEAGKALTDAEVKAARATRYEVMARMESLLEDGAVVCLPTTPTTAPFKDERISRRRSLGAGYSLLNCIAGTTGRPQISLPVAEVDGLPVGLSLIGSRGADEVLLAFVREVEAALPRR